MRYLVYRLETHHGVTYKVTAKPIDVLTRAICVGQLEVNSKRAAGELLKARLRRGLNESRCFFPAPTF